MAVLSAKLTDYARTMLARGVAEGVLLGDWSFQVGTGGFDPLNPDQVTEVDSNLQALVAPVGGRRELGRVLDSGAGASIALTSTPGILQVNGLVLPVVTAPRWLSLSGSADPNVNGLWFVSGYEGDFSPFMFISNPLVDAPDAGPLNWELREFCMQYPNPRAVDFHGVLGDSDCNGEDLGEVGIFCRVLRAPTDSFLLGQTLMYANCHHVARVKVPESHHGLHVCVQH
jgi:hypothetical protein